MNYEGPNDLIIKGQETCIYQRCLTSQQIISPVLKFPWERFTPHRTPSDTFLCGCGNVRLVSSGVPIFRTINTSNLSKSVTAEGLSAAHKHISWKMHKMYLKPVRCWIGSHYSAGHATVLQLTYVLTYLLTPGCRVLLEKLTGLQVVKKFPAFHGTRRFITALTSTCFYPGPVQSSPYTHIPPPGDPS